MNKRGFTLIELLAVIVILGIITLIAIPSVSNIIKNSKERVALANAKTYFSELEKYVTMRELDPDKYTEDLKGKANLEVNSTNDDIHGKTLNSLVNIKGEKPTRVL